MEELKLDIVVKTTDNKRVFTIDLGELSHKKAVQYIERLMKEYKKENYEDNCKRN